MTRPAKFSTRQFVRAHGRAPRGIGDWAFTLDGRGPLWIIGIPFAEAKAEALRRGREVGAQVVEVMP